MLKPLVPRERELQRVGQPGHSCRCQARPSHLEVALVLLISRLGHVQQLDLWANDRDQRRTRKDHLVKGGGYSIVATEVPFGVGDGVVDEVELALR